MVSNRGGLRLRLDLVKLLELIEETPVNVLQPAQYLVEKVADVLV